jgi:hypothetical protein
MIDPPETIEFDGHVWTLICENNSWVRYTTNLGSRKHPRPQNLTRYVWERSYGRPAPGYKVIAIDGNYLNWELSNLKLVRGDSAYVARDTERRARMVQRDDFLHAAIAAGWKYDDAWDRWEANSSKAKQDLGLEDDPG